MTTVLEILMILGLGPLIWLTIRSGTLGSLTHPPTPQHRWTEYDAMLAAQDQGRELHQANVELMDRYSQLSSAYQQAQTKYYSDWAEREKQYAKSLLS